MAAKKKATPPKETPPTPPPADPTPPADFPIIALGASAGGLKAFEQFFQNMPPDSGMAFVLILHLSPDHKSMMAELLKRHTQMAVYEFEDGLTVAPNSIYIIPPHQDLAILNGQLQLLPQVEARGSHHSIDHFFRSLAEDRGEKAIGIILSGTGSDGTVGLRAIKGAGGLALVQAPETAEYDGMPRSAIATGQVDLALPVEQMPATLLHYVKQYRLSAGEREQSASTAAATPLQKLFVLLRSQTGHDFSMYKANTILRRVERRMTLQHIADLTAYVTHLRLHPQEIETLFNDLVIGVTNFFRDPEAFALLKEKGLPHLFQNVTIEDPLRVWVAGCSTGEEAYSLAILLLEYLEAHGLSYKVQIFATDIDHGAIETARTGLYPEAIAVDVAPERLERYFSKQNSSYLIRKEVRDMIVFATQSIIKDPPFSRLDLISCRNLLIYLNSDLQQKVLSTFHYVLKPDGLLFLGASESIGSYTDRFTVFDKKWKIFKAKPGGSLLHSMTTLPHRAEPLPPTNETAPAATKAPATLTYTALAQSFLLNRFAPASLLINRNGDILYVHGRTGPYLELAPGEVRTNLLAMAREGLAAQLQTLIRRSFAEQREVRADHIRVKTNGGHHLVNVSIKPVYNQPTDEGGLAMVLFEAVSAPPPPPAEGPPADEGPVDQAYVRSLEEELGHTKEDLQATIEEVEAANEEMQSTNEEMQSTNEELETSKEELQSLNEELVTVNTELQTKIDALTDANSDIVDLLNSIHLPTIFLDNDLTIKRFTQTTGQVINLIASDVGRPLSDLSLNFEYKNLIADVKSVLHSLTPLEKALQTADGHWYILRIRPYRTNDNVIAGVVLTFIDIDRQKLLEESLQECEARIRSIFTDTPIPIMLHTVAGEILMVNRAFTELSGYSLEDIPTSTEWFKKGQGMSDSEANAALVELQALLAAGPPYKETELTIFTKTGRKRRWRFMGPKSPSGQTYITSMALDITE